MHHHKFDAVSFVLGVLVIGIGITFMLGAHGSAWVAPVLLIGIGAAFLAAALQRALAADPADEH